MNNEEKDLIEELAEKYGFTPEAIKEMANGKGDEDEQQSAR